MDAIRFLVELLGVFSTTAALVVLAVLGIGYGLYRARRMILYRYYRARRRRMPGWKPASTGAPRRGRPASPAVLRSIFLTQTQPAQNEHRRAQE